MHAGTEAVRRATHKRFVFGLGLALLAFCSGALAVAPPTGTVTTLNNVGQFDGSQNLLTSCVALQNADGSTQLDANGKARVYDIVLSLNRANLTFKLQSATPFDTSAGKDCSGVFKSGVYTDASLISNLAPLYNGKVWNLTLDYVANSNLEFKLRIDSSFAALPVNTTPAVKGEVNFNFAATTSPADQALIRETVLFAQDFLHSTFGRTLEKTSTITTLGQAAGCSNPGASAFAGSQSLTFCTSNMGWTIHGPVTKRKILIHEVFHLLQFELRWLGNAQGTITGPHWLIEGAAEYIGWLGIAARGDVPLETAHGCMLKEVADFAPGLPNLSGLETAQSFGGGPVYPLAMIGTNQLVNGSNVAKLLTYGSALAAGTAWTTAFSDAFGTTSTAFYAQFPAYRTSQQVPATYACRL